MPHDEFYMIVNIRDKVFIGCSALATDRLVSAVDKINYPEEGPIHIQKILTKEDYEAISTFLRHPNTIHLT